MGGQRHGRPRALTGRGSIRFLLCAVVALLPLLNGCSQSTLDPDPVAARHADEQLVLRQRARAVRNHDLAGFMRTVSRSDPSFVRWQRTWFHNMSQLPLARFSYRVLDQDWPRTLAAPGWGSQVQIPRVRVTLQLEGYDSAPEHRTTGFAFRYGAHGLQVVSDRTGDGKPFPDSGPAPWDLAAVQVRRGINVLGVFDSRTVGQASELLDTVEDGIRDVDQALPFSWPGRVVVYLFRDPALLDSFADVPGGNIRHLGAMSFPVRRDGPGSRPVAMRFTLLPSSVAAGEPFLGRIVRHELTHVALGSRDDGAPAWLDEGVAEYVGARPLPRSQRRIASVALGRARAGVDALPPTQGFNGPDQDWHYALAWMACDYIAATDGEARLWRLVRAMHDHGRGTPDSDQDRVLRRVLGYDGAELARRAGQRILQIYG